MSSSSPFLPPTVCSWHHRTKVHLAGHWLPGALLTDREPKAPTLTCSVWSGRTADLRDSLTSLARLRQLWFWPSLRGLSWCLYVWVWTFLWSAVWTKALWADTLGSFYWHHIQMDPQVTGYQAVQIIVSDYLVECDIWKRSYPPLSRNRGWCGGVLP